MANKFIKKNYKINTKKLDKKCKIVFVSDLHNENDKNYLDKLIFSICEENVDYVLFGGDLITFSKYDIKHKLVNIDNAIYFLTNLSKKLNEKSKLIFSYGNHELRLRKFLLGNDTENINFYKPHYETYIDTLQKCGVKILDDDFVEFGNIKFYGLSLYEGYYHKGLFINKNNKHIEKIYLQDKFGTLDKNKYNVCLFHNPQYAQDLIDYGFDLILSGHNHGGLVRFPIIGSVLGPEFQLFPKYDGGHYHLQNGDIVVSSGLGDHFIKVRINNMHELCVLEIN